MTARGVVIRHVQANTGHVSAYVTTSAGTIHHVGRLPKFGWFCVCKSGKRCKQIQAIKDLVCETLRD